MKLKIVFLFFLIIPFFASSQEAMDGKELFRNYCKACHNIDKKLVGPALKGIHERRDSTWIYNFIKGSQAMIEAGDPTAVALFAEYNEVLMPNQPVNDAQIAAILAYIKKEGEAVVAGDGELIPRPAEAPKVYSNHFRFSNYAFWIPFTIMVILLAFVLYYMTIYSDIVDKEVEGQ